MADRDHERETRAPDRPPRPWARRLAVVLALALAGPGLAPVPPAAAEEVGGEDETGAPDYSAVTTDMAARRLVREGLLVEVSLFPTELGGPDDPLNRVYIPAAGAEARDLAIGEFLRFGDEGLIDRLRVVPEYEGDSKVPRRIVMFGSHSEHGDEAAVAVTVELW